MESTKYNELTKQQEILNDLVSKEKNPFLKETYQERAREIMKEKNYLQISQRPEFAKILNKNNY